jgi:hypothetical protein
MWGGRLAQQRPVHVYGVPRSRFGSLDGDRRPVGFAVTRHPTAEWLAPQIVEAFRVEYGTDVRHNDGAYGHALHKSSPGDGDSRSPDFAEVSLAEPLC